MLLLWRRRWFFVVWLTSGYENRCAVTRDLVRQTIALLSSSARGAVQNFFSMVLPGSAGDHE
jgi:hypothetical protein